MHAAVPTSDQSAHMSKVDAEHNRVVLHVGRLGNPSWFKLMLLLRRRQPDVARQLSASSDQTA